MPRLTPEQIKTRREDELAEAKLAMAEYLAEPEQRALSTAKQREARLARDAAATATVAPAKKALKKKVLRSW